MPAPKFTHKDLGKAALKRQLTLLKHRAALVGIPGGLSADEGKTTLATVALVLEKGSEVMKIPPRPFMQQTREKAETGRFPKIMAGLYKLVADGKLKAEKAIKTLGMAYEGEMKNIFLTGEFVPNSPITIGGGWMRNRVSGKAFKVKGKGSSRPLIDTGHLRQSITNKVVNV